MVPKKIFQCYENFRSKHLKCKNVFIQNDFNVLMLTIHELYETEDKEKTNILKVNNKLININKCKEQT